MTDPEPRYRWELRKQDYERMEARLVAIAGLLGFNVPGREGVGHYNGEKFFMTPYWQFWLVDSDKKFDTYREMCEFIDRKQKAVAASKRKKIDVKVLDANGEEVVITGINAGNGNLTTSPKRSTSGWRGFVCYPVSDVAREAIAKRKLAKNELYRVQKVLDSLELDLSDRKFDVDKFGDRLNYIEKTVDSATTKANKATFDKEYAKFANLQNEPIEFD